MTNGQQRAKSQYLRSGQAVGHLALGILLAIGHWALVMKAVFQVWASLATKTIRRLQAASTMQKRENCRSWGIR